MAKTFVVYKGITAYASIQNIGDRISVSQLELDFAVNQIPKATVVLSMGQLADGSKSPIQEKLNSLEQRLAVKIYLVVTTADSGSASPSPTLIFNGYTSACSYSKTYGSCSIVLGVVSVLNDLAYSSAFSDLFSTASVGDFFRPMVWKIGAAGVQAATAQALAAAFAPKLRSDFWEAALKDSLISMCTAPLLKPSIAQPGTGVAGNTVLNNKLALNILNDYDETIDPVQLQPDLAHDRVFQAMGLSIANALWSQGRGVTVWSKMLSQLSAFGVGFIPAADGFMVAPVAPMLASTITDAFTDIGAAEYSSIVTTGFRRPISGVKFVVGSSGLSGVSTPARQFISAAFGWCTPSNDGQLLVVPAPAWVYLNGTTTADDIASGATIFSGGSNPTAVPAGETKANQTVTDLFNSWGKNGPAPRLAHMVFCNEAFRGNTATLSGKLRFDIPPAACVRVEAAGNDLYTSKKDEKQYFYANVEGVRINISVAPGQTAASTTFFLSHVRTKADDAVAETEHPLFTTYFKGSTYNIAYVKELEKDIAV